MTNIGIEENSLMTEAVHLIRQPHLTETVLFVDGLPGCGKTLMTSIVSGLDRVELMQYAYELEYVCALTFLRKIQPDAACTLVRIFTDLRLYNGMMSREANFRWTDLSGVRSNPRPWRYVRRLFEPGDEKVIEKIQREYPILQLVSHLLLGISPILFEALGDRMRLIEVVRHPLYMLKQQFKYMPRWATDPRDFSIWFDYRGKTVPWFAKGWEEKFTRSSPMDQAIHMIDMMQRLQSQTLESLSRQQRDQIMTIPFERFVTNPELFLQQMERFLGTRVTAVTRRVMKQQNVPRKLLSEGIGLPIYKQYGWEPPARGATEKIEFERRRQFAAEHATQQGMDLLDRLCQDYEKKYLSQELPS